MKKRYEVFSMNGCNDKAVKSFKNEPEAVAFARTHDDMILTKQEDGCAYVWDSRYERWEKNE